VEFSTSFDNLSILRRNDSQFVLTSCYDLLALIAEGDDSGWYIQSIRSKQGKSFEIVYADGVLMRNYNNSSLLMAHKITRFLNFEFL
jgi:hypothetical protein